MFAQVGQAGELRAGPYVAARFGAWSLVRPDDTLGDRTAWVTLRDLRVIDTFWIVSDPLDLWLQCGRAWWIWRGVVIEELGAPRTTCRTRGDAPDIRPV